MKILLGTLRSLDSEEGAYTPSRQSGRQQGADSSAKSELTGKRTSPENCRSGDFASPKSCTDSKDKLTLDTSHSRINMNSMQYPPNHKPAPQISFSGYRWCG